VPSARCLPPSMSRCLLLYASPVTIFWLKKRRERSRAKSGSRRLNFPWQKQKYNENKQQIIALKLAHGHQRVQQSLYRSIWTKSKSLSSHAHNLGAANKEIILVIRTRALHQSLFCFYSENCGAFAFLMRLFACWFGQSVVQYAKLVLFHCLAATNKWKSCNKTIAQPLENK